jgi:hypothetical protein
MIEAPRHQRCPRLLRLRHSLRSAAPSLVLCVGTRSTTAVWLVLRCVTVDWGLVDAGTATFGFGGHFFFALATALAALGGFRFFGCGGFACGLFLAGSTFFACDAANPALFFAALVFFFAGSLLACFALPQFLFTPGSSLFGFTGFGFSCVRGGLARCALCTTSCSSSLCVFGLGFAAGSSASGVRGKSFSISIRLHGTTASIVTASAIVTLCLCEGPGIFIPVRARLATVWHLGTRRLPQ